MCLSTCQLCTRDLGDVRPVSSNSLGAIRPQSKSISSHRREGGVSCSAGTRAAVSSRAGTRAAVS